MTQPLSSFQENFLLSAYPAGTRILSARFHRNVRLPCPIWVRVVLPQGEELTLILRMDYSLHGVERETTVLPILAKLGLPVPVVLAGPVFDPLQLSAGAMTLLSVLPGQDLLGWSWNAPSSDQSLALQLVLEGVEWLHALTEQLSQEPVARQLPRKTLLDELQEVITDGGPWLDEPVFTQAIDLLWPIVTSIQVPLAFSSGDEEGFSLPQATLFQSVVRQFLGFSPSAAQCQRSSVFDLFERIVYALRNRKDIPKRQKKHGEGDHDTQTKLELSATACCVVCRESSVVQPRRGLLLRGHSSACGRA
jgi:hypothetical protein